MFLRPCYRSKNGKQHAYWALVESYRSERGPRQRVVATKIPRDALQELLIQFLPPFDRVTTGYSTYKEECIDTFTYGANNNLVLFGEHDAEHVTKLWLTIYGLSEHDTELASRMFRLLSQWDLLIVDRSMSALLALNDVDAVGQYLAEICMADNT